MAADNRATPEGILAAEYRRLERLVAGLLLRARAGERVGRALTPAFLEGQLEQVRRELARLERATAEWTTEHVAEGYRRSAGAAQTTLRQAGVAMIEPRFTGLDRSAVRALQARVSSELAAVRRALVQGLALGDPREAVGAIREAITGDSRLVRLVGGEAKVATTGGRLWDPSAYSKMLGRTTIADARRVSFRNRYLANGVDVVRVVENGSTHPVCQAWEGELLSLTGETPGLPTVEDARADGLFHPNCRHRYVVATDVEQPGLPIGEAAEPPPPEPALPILGRLPATTRAPAEAQVPTESRLPPPRG